MPASTMMAASVVWLVVLDDQVRQGCQEMERVSTVFASQANQVIEAVTRILKMADTGMTDKMVRKAL